MKNGCALPIAYWICWLLFVCVYSYTDNIDRYNDSERLKGVVVEKLLGRSRKTSGYYEYPQVSFIYKDSAYLFGQSNGWFISTYNIVDKMKIIFPKGNPDKAERYWFLSYWVSLPVFFFSFMIALFIFVIPIFFRMYSGFRKEYKGR